MTQHAVSRRQALALNPAGGNGLRDRQEGAHAARRGAGPAACLHLDAKKRGGGLKRNPRSGGSTPIVAEAKFSPPGLILPKSGVFSSLLNKADPPGWWLSRKETF